MTDTEYTVDDDEVSFEVDEDEGDEIIDFENLLPPDGAWEAVIKDVSYRNAVREADGVRVLGLNVRVILVDPGGEFDGTLLSNYIWLGNDKFMPSGRAQMKVLCNAVGLPCEGQVNMADYGKTRQTIGKKEETVLSAFSGLPCGVFTKIGDNTYNGQTTEQCKPVAFITLDRLAQIRDHDLGEEQF